VPASHRGALAFICVFWHFLLALRPAGRSSDRRSGGASCVLSVIGAVLSFFLLRKCRTGRLGVFVRGRQWHFVLAGNGLVHTIDA